MGRRRTSPPQRPWPDGCPSDLQLDAYRAGELSRRRLRRLSAHLDECETCGGRVDEEPPELESAEDWIVKLIDRRIDRPRRADAGRARAWRTALILAASVACLTVAVPLIMKHQEKVKPGPAQPPAQGEILLKGADTSLAVFVQRDGEVTQAADGDTFHPGERIQFSAVSDRPRYVAVYGIDGLGVTRYIPSAFKQPLRLAAGEETPLEPAFNLDGTLGEEVVVGLFCERPFDAAEVKNRLLAREEPGATGAVCTSVRFTMVKKAREGGE